MLITSNTAAHHAAAGALIVTRTCRPLRTLRGLTWKREQAEETAERGGGRAMPPLAHAERAGPGPALSRCARPHLRCSGNSTKSTKGLSSRYKLNSESSCAQPPTLAATPKNILKPTFAITSAVSRRSAHCPIARVGRGGGRRSSSRHWSHTPGAGTHKHAHALPRGRRSRTPSLPCKACARPRRRWRARCRGGGPAPRCSLPTARLSASDLCHTPSTLACR